MNNIIQDNIIGLLLVTVFVLFLLNKNRIIKLANRLAKVLRIEPTQWHEPETIPEPSKYNERISDDIIIRDLVTEKEFLAYYDFEREHYIDYKCNMVWGAFIWRYDE